MIIHLNRHSFLKRIVLVFTVCLCVKQIWAAEEYCMIKPVEDRRVKERANQIRFPNGRLITIVGHSHGSRGALQLAMTMNSTKKYHPLR